MSTDEKNKMNKQMSDSFKLGVLLTIIGGFLDAYTYICRGKVFANAQTGNIVLLAMKLAESKYHEAFSYFIPIMAFVFGIFISEMIKLHFKEIRIIHWRQIIIALEILILLGIAFVPQNLNMAVNCIISFVCALQVQSFRKIEGNVCATTMCTGNLRTATELLFLYSRNKDKKILQKSLMYYGINIVFVIGAFIGTIFTNYFSEVSILFCSFLLSIVFIMMFCTEKVN